MRTLVSIDIETTGFDPRQADVIEIAGVKEVDGKITETFRELVKPSHPIPETIEVITGISNEMVKDAKSLEDIQADFEDFIQDGILLGHNIAFDIGFLKGKGFDMNLPSYDTWKLAIVVLPHAPSHSLEILTKEIGIDHLEKHRAEDDSKAVLQLFSHLEKEIRKIPRECVEEVIEVAKENSWQLLDVFAAALKDMPSGKKAKTQEKKKDHSTSDPVLESLEHLFQDEERVGEKLEEYKLSEQQIEISRIASQTLKEGGSAIVETGARVGRSIGYLLPVLAETTPGGRTLVSVKTHKTAEQIRDEALPRARGMAKKTPSHAFLEGSSQYICLKRLREWKDRKDLSQEELHSLARLLLWVPQMREGRFSEIGLVGYDDSPEGQLSACGACEASHGEDGHEQCPWNEAKKKAEEADVVFVLHSVLSDGMPKDIGAFRHVVVDEADMLHTYVTDQQTRRWSADRARDAVAQAERFLDKETGLLDKIDLFFGLVGSEAEQERDPYDKAPMWSVRIGRNMRLSGTFWKIEKAAKNLLVEMQTLSKELVAGKKAHLAADVIGFADLLRDAFIKERENSVSWLEIRENESVAVVQAPVFVDEWLSGHYWAGKHSVLLFGNTLFEKKNGATYIRDMVGLPSETVTISLSSGSSSIEKANVFIGTDMPEPGKPGFLKALSGYVSTIAENLNGRTAVLSSSNAGVKALHREIALPLKKKEIQVLGQKVSGGKKKIMQIFSEKDSKAVLIGGRTFWNILNDLGENSIKCLIITKIPFDPPSKPIVEARNEIFERAFVEYTLPESLLTVRNAMDQAISIGDQPVHIVFLDTRIKSRPYGSDFAQLFPDFGVEEGDIGSISEFLKR